MYSSGNLFVAAGPVYETVKFVDSVAGLSEEYRFLTFLPERSNLSGEGFKSPVERDLLCVHKAGDRDDATLRGYALFSICSLSGFRNIGKWAHQLFNENSKHLACVSKVYNEDLGTWEGRIWRREDSAWSLRWSENYKGLVRCAVPGCPKEFTFLFPVGEFPWDCNPLMPEAIFCENHELEKEVWKSLKTANLPR